MADVLRNTLMYAALPLWSLAGLVDWWCHRRTGIEQTSGVGESAFHLAMFSQMALASLAALFLEINALVLALMALLFLTHEATTWFELRFVHPVRDISPAEQMVHSFMEIIPLGALAMLAALHADQLAALLGQGEADWGLRLKADPLPAGYLAAALAGIFCLNVLPLLEEFLRCWRWRVRAGRLAH
ncbi:MAG: diguanylate cyclase [Polaromonas sp.]|nr:diguanylate cyclase [Polaromonas sp.]